MLGTKTIIVMIFKNYREKKKKIKIDKKTVFKFLDKNYPITNNSIDISFDTNINDVIINVLGITNITFNQWVDSKYNMFDIYILDDKKGNSHYIIKN